MFWHSRRGFSSPQRVAQLAFENIRVSVNKQPSRSIDDLAPLKNGQCMMDQFGFGDHEHVIEKGVDLWYNRKLAKAHLEIPTDDKHETPSMFNSEEGWKKYPALPFEHSDTCPSRIYRQILDDAKAKAAEGDFKLAKDLEEMKKIDQVQQYVKMAVCCYIMDKDDNLLLTKRPDFLKIFPNVWVLPGGIVEYKETLEDAIFREIEEEVGMTLEYTDDYDPKCDTFQMCSPLRHDQEIPIPVTFEPFYLYESVTKSILGSVD